MYGVASTGLGALLNVASADIILHAAAAALVGAESYRANPVRFLNLSAAPSLPMYCRSLFAQVMFFGVPPVAVDVSPTPEYLLNVQFPFALKPAAMFCGEPPLM